MRFFLLFLSTFYLFAPSVYAQDLIDPRIPLYEPQAGTESTAPNEYADVPYHYLEEADKFHDRCQGDERLQNYYDCECLSVKFLDKRIEEGPGRDPNALLLAIDGECKEATYLAGATYTGCLRNGVTVLPKGKEMEEFCGCFANEYASLFEKSKRSPSSRLFTELQAQARTNCR